MTPCIRHYPDLSQAARELAGELVELTATAMAARGLCSWVLAGGSTPRLLYRLLATEEYRRRIDWSRLHLFWGDERWLPHAHPDSNFRLVRESLLDFLETPPAAIHPMPVGGESPVEDACRHDSELAGFFPASHGLAVADRRDPDIVLLGMGEDGHVASLFPGDPALAPSSSLVTAVMPPPDARPAVPRLSMTLPLLNRARHQRVLLGGEAKSRLLLSLDRHFPLLPVARLRSDAIFFLAART